MARDLSLIKKQDSMKFVPNDDLLRKIKGSYQGYMWSNRIYLSNNSANTEETAETLIHEINHVLNCSEQNYYKEEHVVDYEKAFLEEYRAFVAECVFKFDTNDPKKCSKYALKQLKDLGYPFWDDKKWFGKDVVSVAQEILNDSGKYGYLVPNIENWELRNEP